MAGGLSLCTNPTFPLLTLLGKKKQKTSVCKMVTLSLYFVSVVFVGLYSTMLSAYHLMFLYNFCKGAETKH